MPNLLQNITVEFLLPGLNMLAGILLFGLHEMGYSIVHPLQGSRLLFRLNLTENYLWIGHQSLGNDNFSYLNFFCLSLIFFLLQKFCLNPNKFQALAVKENFQMLNTNYNEWNINYEARVKLLGIDIWW